MDMRNALRNGSEEMQQIFRELGAQMNARAEKEREQKVRNYRSLNARAEKGQILFTGSSLMEQFPIAELALAMKLDKKVYNRGIGGFTTEDFLREIDTVLFDLEPSVVFMNIGTNDFREWPDGRDWKSSLLKNYEDILRHCKERLPDSKFYLMAYYPVNGELPNAEPGAVFMLKVRTNENLADVNQEIAKLATRYGYEFIDVNQGLTDENGNLKTEYTIEGVHMYSDAYCVVFDNLKKYLCTLTGSGESFEKSFV